MALPLSQPGIAANIGSCPTFIRSSGAKYDSRRVVLTLETKEVERITELLVARTVVVASAGLDVDVTLSIDVVRGVEIDSSRRS